MKKSLLAVAAIGAFASAAQAQSSVTVYGILDVGFQGVSTRGPLGTVAAGTNGAAAGQTFSNVPTNANYTRFNGEGAETTSRLGFRGTEDLGGGTSAFFTAEFALAPTDNRLGGDANNGISNRQTFVGLKKNGIGQAAIGTQYTPIHTAVGRTDPGQQNNMAGNVIYATNTSQGQGETTTSYTVRLNNSLTLQTERYAGFQLNGIYNNQSASSNNTLTGIATSTNVGGTAGTGYGAGNQIAYGLGLNYVWQKLNVDAAFQTLKNTNFGSNVQLASTLPANATAASPGAASIFGTSVGQDQSYVGATYDFGILKAYAQYVNNKVTSNLNSNNYLQRSAQQIGVRSFVTPAIEVWASGGTGRVNAGVNQGGGNVAGSVLPTGQSTQNFTGYQLGSNYLLSKRTNLYAIYGSTQVSSTSVNISEGRSSYGVGLRHTF
ncbi:porin [Polynucleobacter sp. Nonnen-W13]|uniref:porin n=1 Tax=Polynucleobacter sp. Nonnen-W13 TaxID=1855625 RepID=UPI001C0C5E35|nr:porin [Polynucleobacter sp. Nonnen-W13]MBU3558168.1 porin [Polynucleobacter sp. Nonnen-W13]